MAEELASKTANPHSEVTIEIVPKHGTPRVRIRTKGTELIKGGLNIIVHSPPAVDEPSRASTN